MAPVTKCGVCKKSVTKTDLGVECETCLIWYHAACVNIGNDLYTLMGKSDNITYNCNSCTASRQKKDSSYITKGFEELNKKFMDCFSAFSAEIRTEQQSLKNLIEASITSIRADLSTSVNEVQKNLDQCKDNLQKVEQNTMTKLDRLEAENHKLQRRLNRSDILISGLPAGIDGVLDPVLALCSFYGVAVVASDINHCLYVQHGKTLLVKFNSVFLKDRLMKAYFKNQSVVLKDIIDTELNTRVYINNNLTAEEVKLRTLCLSLRKNKKITWFKLMNGDTPLAKVKLDDGSINSINFQQGLELRES